MGTRLLLGVALAALMLSLSGVTQASESMKTKPRTKRTSHLRISGST